jgi:hypothetical protein
MSFGIKEDGYVAETIQSSRDFLLERGFEVAFMADDGALEQIRRTALHRLEAPRVNPARGDNLLAVVARGAPASRLGALYPQLELGPT